MHRRRSSRAPKSLQLLHPLPGRPRAMSSAAGWVAMRWRRREAFFPFPVSRPTPRRKVRCTPPGRWFTTAATRICSWRSGHPLEAGAAPMSKRIAIIQGHPDPRGGHLGHALAQGYAEGGERAGNEIKVIQVAALQFPLVHTKEEWET